MILKTAAMLLQSDNNFDGAFGDDPEPHELTLGLPFDAYDLLPILGAVCLLILVWVVAQAIGDMRAHRRLHDGKRAAAESLYDEIDAALNRALRAPGGYQLDKARELRDLVQARFGYVIALNTRPGKTLEGLEKALEADGGELETSTSTPAKIKVAMASEEHRLVVWQGLQKFRAYWDRKAHILALIEQAQHELAPRRSGAYALAQLEQKPPEARAAPVVAAAAIVAAALADADAAAVPPVPAPVKSDDDTPPPSPPPPPPGRGKKLPAHKRNMLA